MAGVAHQAGTCRFGTDPATSVLDVNCRAHELDNLYVVDTSFFPSIGAVNPALTAMANALRVGDHLLERLGAHGMSASRSRAAACWRSTRCRGPGPRWRSRSRATSSSCRSGVSWAFMALIANYRAIKRDDHDALLLAQRWSKYMAVTFAVGAVTGTVLTFEFGLLWPRFMGQWGEAFGIPFAFEGLFFFTEAIFIAIYIFGWRRLRPWPHFWTGVPDRAGRHRRHALGGRGQRVDERAGGVHPEQRRQGRRRRSAGGDLQRRRGPTRRRTCSSPPTSSAASSSPRCTRSGCCGAAGTATTGSGSSSRSPSRRSPPRSRWRSATRWPAGSTTTSRPSSRRSSSCPRPSSDVPETLLGRLNSDGTVTGGIAIPGLASWLSDPSDGTATVVQGLDAFPADERPTIREVNTVHLAWDVMVGLGTLLFLLSALVRLAWIFRRDMPRRRLVPAHRLGRRGAAVIAMEAGWVVTEVGRQPWIVHGHMKVEDAATANAGVWITFIVVVRPLHRAWRRPTILVLRGMSRRFRRRPSCVDTDVPYGPRELPAGADAGTGARRWMTPSPSCCSWP